MNEILIVSCSSRKRPQPGPAILVYDGPLFRILRQQRPRVELYVLSARYGLIPASRRIEPYDVTMANPLISLPQVGEQWLEAGFNRNCNIYICLTLPYARFLDQVVADYSRNGRIFRIGEPDYPIGRLGQALKKWCFKKQGEIPEWISLCLQEA